MIRILIPVVYFLLFAFFIDARGQSCGMRSLSLSYSLNDVAFVSEEAFVAIGGSGKILKTENGGKNWKEIITDANSYLRKIQMVNKSIGYILGDYGVLLKTDDGGNSWFPLKKIVTEYPYCQGLHFLTPDTGFVFGGDGKIFKTNDGGRSWTKKSYYSFDELNSMAFINDSTGFVCGRSNTLMKTSNCGESWNYVNMSPLGFARFVKIIFADENTGYILCEDGKVIKTTNGGDNWVKVGEAYTDFAVSMVFQNKNIGFMVGGWTFPSFYRTMNGGLTWQRVSFGQAGSLSGIAINKSGTKGVVVGHGAGYGYTSEAGRFILYYNDMDKSWKNACYLNGSNDFRTVAFPDSLTGYLTGGYYQSQGIIYKTYDKGLTWNPLSFYPKNNVFEIFTRSRDTIYVSADSTYKTTDGGVTWQSLTPVTGKMYFNRNNGVLQDFYSIYRSDNHGKTWDKTLTVSGFLTDMFFKDPSNGYAVGYYCSYSSTDSGKNWSPYTSLPARFYSSIYFQNKDTGFAGGDNGLLYRTRNGGISWDSIATGITNLKIYDIKFINDTLGYLIGNNDGGLTNVYSSIDGGNTWKFLQQTSEDIRNIVLDRDGNLYFPGKRGVLNQIVSKSPPGIASSITGPLKLLKNTDTVYSVLPYPGSSFRWKVSNNLSYQDYGDSIKLNFPVSGIYEISIVPYNGCGTGVLRKIEISVLDSFPVINPGNPTNIIDVEEKAIPVYPNPFDKELNVVLPAEGKYLISLYNSQGKAVMKAVYEQHSHCEVRITVPSNLHSGIYMMEIERNQFKSRVKLVKIN